MMDKKIPQNTKTSNQKKSSKKNITKFDHEKKSTKIHKNPKS